jgi:hypothetical protein
LDTSFTISATGRLAFVFLFGGGLAPFAKTFAP